MVTALDHVHSVVADPVCCLSSGLAVFSLGLTIQDGGHLVLFLTSLQSEQCTVLFLFFLGTDWHVVDVLTRRTN